MTTQPLNRLQIAWRTAQDVQEGMLVNLGLGMPVAVADYIRPEVDVFIQSENGVIGVGPLAAPERVDTDLVDAGSRRVTIRPGASIVDSSWSFAMIRGGHVDVAILGLDEDVDLGADVVGDRNRHAEPEIDQHAFFNVLGGAPGDLQAVERRHAGTVTTRST